ncbi:tyrosine-type recombinase/integrase [Nocardioidaceae bacterium SCSIO 66511]|nr:tyrosine-type recombinase/integrase [Nocardioidaceae bacterium SCSIO 66511]
MSREPLPLGTWGKIRTYVLIEDEKGRPVRSRAMTKYRDFDGVTRQVEAQAKTTAQAENKLRSKLRERSAVARRGELTELHRFSAASEVWMTKLREMVDDEKRSPGTVDTYERQLANHVLPALGELRLGEVTTPLVDKFIGQVKADVGPPTARTCRSVVSGVMGVAVRFGAVAANPVREVDRVESKAKRQPRALTAKEWRAWLARLRADEKAVARDLPDLSLFMMGTGVRIGEALAVQWSQVDLSGQVAITHTIVRVKGQGLLRKRTKSQAGERTLALPLSLRSMLRSRFMVGVRLDDPVFPNTVGGYRDPSNTRRELREARGDDLLSWVTSHNFRKTAATVLDDAGHSGRQVADQIGHSRPSLTQDVYLGRKVANPRAAEDLEQFIDGEPDEHDPSSQKDG